MTLARLYLLLKPYLPSEPLRRAVAFYHRVHSLVRYGDWTFPNVVNLEVSTYCNRTCLYCPNHYRTTPRLFMTDAVFEKCLERLAELKWTGVVDYAHFNEPLLDRRLPELVRRTLSRLPRAKPRVYTNGDALTEKLADELIEAGVVNFSVTRHDQTPEDFDRRILPLARKWPGHFTLNCLHGTMLGRRGSIVKEIDPKLFTLKTLTRCPFPTLAMHISWEGNVMMCCCDWDHTTAFGNVMKQGLMDIWRGHEYARLRHNVGHGLPELPICLGCFGKLP